MQVFNDYFKAENLSDGIRNQRVGFAMYEIYAARKSPFWLSPAYTSNKDSYNTDVFRFDVFWVVRGGNDIHNPQVPVEFYKQFWQLLDEEDIEYRCHWGKYLSLLYMGQEHKQRQLQSYPKLEKFKKKREKLDPNNVFLAPYWKEALQIEPIERE